ncbi:hypothetical protein NPIL_253891 [Nephila pilipes]|uniref:Uncharacterized protein n=1 Tax=Nephila pilipes TaxID=299642 RepID=A0A8X6I7U8_NEPPI|nr:hypothetical protein NPIL_253891 [Nephila pilipes]
MTILEALKLQMNTYHWTDSMTILNWILNTERWNTFVGNRVKEVKTRLVLGDDVDEFQRPIVLSDHLIVLRMTENFQKAMKHSGVQAILTQFWERYWIPRGRSIVRENCSSEASNFVKAYRVSESAIDVSKLQTFENPAKISLENNVQRTRVGRHVIPPKRLDL